MIKILFPDKAIVKGFHKNRKDKKWTLNKGC